MNLVEIYYLDSKNKEQLCNGQRLDFQQVGLPLVYFQFSAFLALLDCIKKAKRSSKSIYHRTMDSQHLKLMENVGKGILQVAEAEEKRLDAQLRDLENLGELKHI